MKLPDILSASRKADRTTALSIAGVLIVTIAIADSISPAALSLGPLYLLPIMLAALYVNRRQLLTLAILCTVLREAFGRFEWGWGVATRTFFGLLAFCGSGLFVEELARRRRASLRHVQELSEQVGLRQEAEEELRVLIETSPAAILTVDGEGRIRLANLAAGKLLGVEGPALGGERIGSFLPVLAEVPQYEGGGRVFRTVLECRGKRKNGEVFPAHVWISTYSSPSGPKLAAIVLDTSEELRDREELGFERLMSSSRVLVRAVSHEIRNLCAAIAVVHENLKAVPGIARNEDFKALGTLVDGLGKLVSAELRIGSEQRPAVKLNDVLDELRIIVEPSLQEEEIALRWQVPESLPAVSADHHGLLHVFMNLVSNSRRAMRDSPQKELAISVGEEPGRVVVRFTDTGTGVRMPERLFQPFQQQSDGAGLGLYLSRALVRSFAGDLRYEPRGYGSCFAVELPHARHAVNRSS